VELQSALCAEQQKPRPCEDFVCLKCKAPAANGGLSELLWCDAHRIAHFRLSRQGPWATNLEGTEKMKHYNQEQAVVATALLQYFASSNDDDFDFIESMHTTSMVWIRGRQYLLDVTVDPITFDVLSYLLRPAPREKRTGRLRVA
jgi:hypothetical protein